MKCRQKTNSGESCFNNAVINGMCMNHYIKNIKDKQDVKI